MAIKLSVVKHGCLGQHGAIRMTLDLSSTNLINVLVSSGMGGKKYSSVGHQVVMKALPRDRLPNPALEQYSLYFVFCCVTNTSSVGVPQRSQRLWNTFKFRDNSCLRSFPAEGVFYIIVSSGDVDSNREYVSLVAPFPEQDC